MKRNINTVPSVQVQVTGANQCRMVRIPFLKGIISTESSGTRCLDMQKGGHHAVCVMERDDQHSISTQNSTTQDATYRGSTN
eukprot:CAMPEP_0116853136 /NCGR_PEP_ID=MMETSP0418-20121206/17726_1 /TAXON_ID=1158023 /ORGANISM="Astrosyne radiata, Strain 13vi08-1A" /LENGTH=81 /DNA_ID=CAMNT_0004485467 /DNA_START=84 /DNA_END=326 /DNA_ORIENTATION=-